MNTHYYDEIVFARDAVGIEIVPQCLCVSVQEQRAYFYNKAQLETIYSISTATKGILITIFPVTLRQLFFYNEWKSINIITTK
jgi:hypothetical protein